MATTNFGWTTPALGSANNVPADLASLATQIDTDLAALENTVKIGGTNYARQGSWAAETISSPAATYGSVYVWTLTKTLPYTAPAGYSLDVYIISSNSYTIAAAGSTPGQVRVINMGAATATIRLGWRLVKI